MPILATLAPEIVGAGISGVSSIIGNLIGKKSNDDTNKANLELNQMNNEFNERMLDKQLAYNTDMWNKQNEYNSPKAQVQRLKEAGINPVMAMQGQGGGQAASALGVNAPSASSAGIQQAFRPDMSGIQQAADMIYNKRLQEANINNMQEDTTSKIIHNKTAYQEAKAKIMLDIENAKSVRQKRILERDLHELNRSNISADFDLKMQQKREIALRAEGIALENYAKAMQNIALPSYLKIGISQALADLDFRRATTKMTEKQFEHEVEKIIETQARSNGFKLDNSIKERTIEAVVEKAQNEAKMSAHPNNPYSLATMASEQLFEQGDKFINYVNSGLNKHVFKPSKRLWKDTKRSFGLYW